MNIENQVKTALSELCELSKIQAGDIVVIGCSTSEVDGGVIGHNSNVDLGSVIFNAANQVLLERGAFLAAQCCEHLNRAIIIERDAVKNINDIVNVVPQPKAGGSFATAAYNGFKNPVVLEKISADAGLDIGLTLIGMHLKKVAVPVRLSINKIGNATIVAARTRPKFIGGVRAAYNENLL
ncbi:MAG: TIGR01440 family protein [Ruminococcaceae bacterium]|nr:TIGR01440 family protein [Oscillospiraceae bacterium]